MVKIDIGKQYKKALIVGTGGGNDIVSTIIVALKLQKQHIQTDISGILNPAAIHYFGGNYEQPVNKIQQDLKRNIHNKQQKSISFFDGRLPDIVKNAGVNIENFYDFSTRYGTKKLSQGVNELIATNAYDLFVAVDVGGDILARGAKDSTLLSPLMDFASLNLLKNIDIDTLLVEFGLGTDGELRIDGMRDILQEFQEKGLLKGQSNITESDDEVQKFKEIYHDISTTRKGHTATITLETLQHLGEHKDYITPYRFISQIGDLKVRHEFDVTIPHESFGKMYTLQGKQFAEQRKETALSFENTLEQYIKLKTMQSHWKTEMDLFYLWSGDNWTTPQQNGHCLQLLVPSQMIHQDSRKSLIEEGIHILKQGSTDLSIILQEDKNILDMNGVNLQDAGKFSLLSTDPDLSDVVQKTADQILKYQHTL